ncbi:MAG: PRC-barrel domain-containing protein [Methanosphaera sp.]|uniref:PRC-barrel domain-containing protein n=1 Tax=Methanosphaera sp. TaxID=2666342 RepID=UPI0025D5B02B|nr:PRC-barrel domain-containing protein [Methanosphaera sp.]MCI5867128.1 PRC-barrel domain-containing protein [Methanosphaera sp.]MDD6534803.1 PRC-barrel domain-containing protein [Methanosphaera sp.]MDY3955529.1 PRC-barrel domain-containing protein [Methanosphaera sp.]
MRLNKIIGKEVLNEKGSVVGKVTDIEIDTASNRIENIVISPKNKEKGLTASFMKPKGEVLIPYENIKKIGDMIILKKPISEIEEIIEEIQNL